jgi:hypothetical protein
MMSDGSIGMKMAMSQFLRGELSGVAEPFSLMILPCNEGLSISVGDVWDGWALAVEKIISAERLTMVSGSREKTTGLVGAEIHKLRKEFAAFWNVWTQSTEGEHE